MFTLEKLFTSLANGTLGNEDPVVLSETVHYALHYYTPFFSSQMIEELKKLNETFTPKVRMDGCIMAACNSGNFQFIPEITNYAIKKLADRYTPSFLFNALSCRKEFHSLAPFFYQNGINPVLLLRNIESIDHIVRECNFTYTKQLDISLSKESIIEISRCLCLYGKKINYVGPNYLGTASIDQINHSTSSDETFFDTCIDFRDGINFAQVKELTSRYRNNESLYFPAKIESLEKGTECNITTIEVALCGNLGNRTIDFCGEGYYNEIDLLIKMYGESVVTQFTNYKESTLLLFIKTLKTRPDFCANWKPTKICPSFYRMYYGKEIEWDSFCEEASPCEYCDPGGYEKRVGVYERQIKREERLLNRS